MSCMYIHTYVHACIHTYIHTYILTIVLQIGTPDPKCSPRLRPQLQPKITSLDRCKIGQISLERRIYLISGVGVGGSNSIGG